MPSGSPARNFKPWQTPRVLHRRVLLTTTGSAGSAVATAFVPLPAGVLRALAVDYHASAPATTDLVIKADSSTGNTLFTASNTVTDIPIRALGSPGALDEGSAVTAATDATDGGAFFKSGLYFDVAQSDALTNALTVDVWVDVLRYVQVSLYPVGADGSAVVTRTLDMNGAGVLRGLTIDYQNQPVTTDITLKADGSGGTTMFARTDSNTDITTPVGLGLIGVDEANAVIAATDASAGGHPFKRNIYIDVAQGDGQTSGDEIIVIGLWIEQ